MKNEKMFVKDNCNLIINKRVDLDWKEIKPNEVIDFLSNRGLSWHKDYNKDTHLFTWEKDEQGLMHLSIERYDSLQSDLLASGYIIPLYDTTVEKMLKSRGVK